MNRRAKKTTLILLAAGVILGMVKVTGPVSALTYQQDIGVNFTFNSLLQLSLSSADLVIDNLVPGTSADSNVINIVVRTNSANGYTLNASVGNSTDYNTRNLVHSGVNQTATFSSVDYGANIADRANLNDETWAFAYSTDNGSTWANYSGLPLYSDTTHITTLRTSNGPLYNNDQVDFKIAAKASDTQIAGEYNNVINFMLVAMPVPTTPAMAFADAGKTKLNGYYKMQDMNSNICNAIETEDDPLQVIDSRDNKVYWIAKLKDGHCWMTQNLDLDLDSGTTYTHADTDLGWGSDSATTTWTPSTSTIHLNADGETFDSLGTASTDNSAPRSLDVGNWYYAGYDGTTLLDSTAINYLTSTNRVVTSGVITVNNGSGVDYFSNYPFATNGTHGHVGNYYNWTAAVASNDTSGYTTDNKTDISANPQNSICPAGWRLPTYKSASPAYDDVSNEYARLIYLYNNETWVTNSSAKLEEAPLYFVRSGDVSGTSLRNSGYSGYYWTSTVNAGAYAYGINFSKTSVSGSTTFIRRDGKSVRCVARQ